MTDEEKDVLTEGGKEDGFIYDWRKIWMGC